MSRAGGGAFAFVALSGAFALSDAAGCEAFFDASSSFFLSSAFSFSRSDAGLAAVAFVELSATGAAAAPVHGSQPSQWKPLPSLLFHSHFSFQSPAYVWHSFWHVAVGVKPGGSTPGPWALALEPAGCWPAGCWPAGCWPAGCWPAGCWPAGPWPGGGWGSRGRPVVGSGIHGFSVESFRAPSAGSAAAGAAAARRNRGRDAKHFLPWSSARQLPKGDV